MRITRLLLPLVLGLWITPEPVLGQSAELRSAYAEVAALFEQGRYAEAMPFAVEAVRLSEQEFGAEHPTTATLIDNLAQLQFVQGRLDEAETLFARALAIRTASLAADHPDLAASNDGLGQVLNARGRYPEAEKRHWEAVRILEQTLSRRPHVRDRLSRRAALYRARALYNRALSFGQEERYLEAERLIDSVVAVFEVNLGDEHPDLIAPIEHRASMLRALGRDGEADELEAQAAALRKGAEGCALAETAVC